METYNVCQCLRAMEEIMLKHFLKLKAIKIQPLVCGQKNTLKIFAPRFKELEKALNLEGCTVDREKTIGVLIDSKLKIDEMMSKVCQAEYF